MPWEKKADKEKTTNAPTYSTVSAITAYRTSEKEDRAGNKCYDFKKLWVKTFPLQIGCITWSDLDEIVYIGFDKGVIHRLALTSNPLAYNDVSKLHSINNFSVFQLGESSVHTMRVMGIIAEPKQYISVSDAGTMMMTNNLKK